MWRLLLALVALATLGGALLALSSGPAEADATFTVNRAGDAGDGNLANAACDVSLSQTGSQCTLRAAIEEANDATGADTIRFDISGKTSVKTISPTSELPEITDPVTINGYTQPGARANSRTGGNDAILKIQLNGASAGAGASGLVIRTSGSTIKGLAINRFPDNGISISGSGATGNRIEGNFVGTDASGTKDLGNGDEGVDVSNAPGNTIGGTVAAARNVISGNAGAGVLIQASEATGNRILGNFIGTNRGGTAGLGESSSGVVLQGVAGNTVGGASSGARNVISGNGGHGVMIVGSAPPAGNEVLGNFIGTDVTGREDQGNGVDGVRIDSAPGNTVGDTDSASRNVISGNSEHGIEINGPGATGNEVLGNFVGTNKGGTVALGNGGDGVQIENAPNNAVGGAEPGAGNVLSANREEGVRIILAGATGNEVEGNVIGTGADGTGDLGNTSGGVLIANAPGNTVGGAAREAGNVIAHSNFDGVLIFGTGATGNRVLSNRIFANGELGIDLVGNEVTGNDPDDGDTGPNNLQNFPVITSVTQSTLPFNPTTVSGTLNSVPSTSTRSQNFTVQCFAAAPDPAGRFAVAPDPSGHGEGVSFVAQDATVTTNDDGNATFDCNFFFPRELEGTVWSATATNQATGDTSEFSANFTVGSGP